MRGIATRSRPTLAGAMLLVAGAALALEGLLRPTDARANLATGTAILLLLLATARGVVARGPRRMIPLAFAIVGSLYLAASRVPAFESRLTTTLRLPQIYNRFVGDEGPFEAEIPRHRHDEAASEWLAVHLDVVAPLNYEFYLSPKSSEFLVIRWWQPRLRPFLRIVHAVLAIVVGAAVALPVATLVTGLRRHRGGPPDG